VSVVALFGATGGTGRRVLTRLASSAVTVSLLSNHPMPTWSADDWVAMAQARNDARYAKNQAPLSAAIDALIQLEAADQLEQAGRHDEAVTFAANAVQNCPSTRRFSLGTRASSQATTIPSLTSTRCSSASGRTRPADQFGFDAASGHVHRAAM